MSAKDTPPAGDAPVTLEALQAVLADVEAGGEAHRLGRRAAAVLADMVAAPRQAAVYSITELASAFGVHPSTLTRLAKALGYRGFAEFQAVFRRHVAQTGHFYSGQVSRLRDVSGRQHETLEVLSRVAREERGNIQGMLNNLDVAGLEEAVAALVGATRVHVLGMRQSYPLASFFSYGLGMLKSDVTTLNPEHGLAHGLAQMRDGDVLVAIGFAPYTRATVTAAGLARQGGTGVIAITDSYASPLAAQARHTFVAPATGLFFSNSMGAALILIEGLLALVARALGDDALTALQARERLIGALDVEL
ncbi:HTH-type transcriptional regulator MurR [wastewater metagenome]|uniref:HTH-type transcriptional regulator MurR n=2 Tax=unclassified sequences TaxID=12908 RepID=A0A5B8REE8_9ZZZZ|nr:MULTISPECIES: MurR/RpiR family transcriptional regulator [Arhodomonas]QEA05127.1 HTH-type transcriptional regulator MurR [uncultured organism]